MVLLVGCGVLWVGVPVGSFWLAGQLTTSFAYHAPLALVLLISGMIAVSLALAWINDLWLRITGGQVVSVRGVPVQRKGPLEVLLPVCGVLAVIALFVWFFLYAENPGNEVF